MGIEPMVMSDGEMLKIVGSKVNASEADVRPVLPSGWGWSMIMETSGEPGAVRPRVTTLSVGSAASGE